MGHYSGADDKKYNENLKKRIEELKKERNAVIIVHNYQRDEVQDIADITGDSLGLSKAALKIDADVIVFCGVHFMAETAYILNPKKTVLLPVKEAGCPMADMITPEALRQMKKKHPGVPAVCYVNTSAAIKAESDICCTSRNAVEIVRSLKEKQVIFVPDKNLGLYVQSEVPDKEIIIWQGFCPTHIRVLPDQILAVKKLHLNAEFIAHPECNPGILRLADHVTSTGGMIEYVKKSKKKDFIIGTEMGMLYKLKKDNPGKRFFLPTDNLICANMKLTTLGWIAHSLELMVYKVQVPENIRKKAQKSVERMLAVSGEKKWVSISGT
ncbi:MAG: quinolinate synthase NadA [Candidatus Omnitrophica bacterium]|nr:quinolinate synthase NadA [Candidatus Omnitrophota bacterium]